MDNLRLRDHLTPTNVFGAVVTLAVAFWGIVVTDAIINW